MKILLLLLSCAVSYYTYTYSRWALNNGYKRGGAGVMALAGLLMAVTIYSLFLRKPI